MKPGPKPMPVPREQKQAAYRIFKRALRRGDLVRKSRCVVCDEHGYPQRDDHVQAHHEDYSQPLTVVWLCALHHAQRHRELREQHYPIPEQPEVAA